MAKELTRKEKQITQLYIETLEEVSRNADNWISFLKRASYNYKYKFDEQILIYAQKPDAVACAETTIWNKKLKRWVNKGSKGIALITEKDGELGLRFVFDVSDTNSNVYGRKLKLWQAEEKYTDSIIEALEDRFGTMEDKSNLPLAIISTVYNHIVDNMQDYLEELKSVTANSKLETLKPEELENSFLEILIYSTIALTMSRCGLDVNDYIRKDCFNEIEKFNTFETMCILGTATRDFSKEILLEISKTVINLEKQEKNKNYTFERLRKNIYNKENEKGSVENENNLQSERELSNTRLDNRENKQESGTREISKNEASIPKTEQEGNIHNASYEQQTNRPLDTNTGNSEKEDNRVSGTDEETVWNNRGIESEQPNGMGRADEQYSSDSRTDSSKRDNLQLEETQTEKEAENASFFDEQTIRRILEESPNIEKNKVEFSDFIYENNEDKEKCKEYIKQVLGNAYTEFYIDDKRVGYKVNEDNLNLWLGSYLSRTDECFIDWDTITKYCIANNVHYAIPKYNKENYTFMVGDVIHLGLNEFTIISLDNGKMTIYDNQFPLDQRTVVIKDILSKIAENPLNDYLRDRDIPEQEQEKAEENSFNKWLDTFVEEKGIDLGQILEIKTENNTHYFEVGNVIENIKATTPEEQEEIKNMIVKIDFYNGDVVDYFKHLAQALAQNFEQQTSRNYNNEEIDLLDRVLRNHKIYDIEIKIDDKGTLIAKDSYNNQWEDKQFYDFLFNEVFNYNDNGTVELIDDEDFEKLTEYRKKYSNEVVENNVIPKTTRKNNNIEYFDLHPEIPPEERNNFKITDDNLGVGTLKEKYKNNIEAIKVLKLCEEQNRYATPEEQEILSKYVGWGGLKSAFEEQNENWANEYVELKEILTEDEYKNARASSVTAYYTPPVVIRNIYKALQNMGLKQANILEPACGVGNFFGMLPEEVSNCQMYGVELDSISGRIAQQLYQKSTIAVQAYEKTNIPDNFFDVAVGNVPFDDFKPNDRRYNKNKFVLHDYFFAKTLDKVRPRWNCSICYK